MTPHMQTYGSHTGAPILRATDTVRVLAYSCFPNEGTGSAWRHITDLDSPAASNLARSTLLGSSKNVSNLALYMGSSQVLCLRLDSAHGRSVPPLNSSHIVRGSTNAVVAANPFTREVKASTKELVA